MQTYKIPSFIDKDEWVDALDNKLVRVQKHPTEDLLIANYTENAQYKRVWNSATTHCRGLIFDFAGNVIARPFQKFFNYGEDLVGALPEGPIRVQDKMDGSLGIIYREPSTGSWAVSTRGSFTSEQAQHATELLNTKYAEFDAPDSVTVLVEIIYPGNRVVVDYGERDELVLLDVIRKEDGKSMLHAFVNTPKVPFPYAHVNWADSVRDVLNVPQVSGKEGFVLFFPKNQQRVKVKFEEYLAFHRARFGFSTTRLWESMKNGTFDTIIEAVPDEFHREVERERRLIMHRYMEIATDCAQTFSALYNQIDWMTLNPHDARKKFALMVQQNGTEGYTGLMFMLLDGRDPSPRIWELCRPDYRQLFMTYPGQES